MAVWQLILIQILVTGITTAAVLGGFFHWVLRPYLDKLIRNINESTSTIEERVTRGVKRGIGETLRQLPEASVRESTRSFVKFGSDLFEHGLSSFLGNASDLEGQGHDSRVPNSRDSDEDKSGSGRRGR